MRSDSLPTGYHTRETVRLTVNQLIEILQQVPEDRRDMKSNFRVYVDSTWKEFRIDEKFKEIVFDMFIA